MIYIFVLFGSLGILALLFSGRVLLKQRSVRRFVRNMHQRFDSLEERGVKLVQETAVEKPVKSPRVSAIELQQVRFLVRSAEKALAQHKPDEAEKCFIQALTVQPHAIEVQAQLAKLYLTSGRESKAEAMYRELVHSADDVSYFANLGLAYYKQEKYIDACYAYQEALNRDPKNPDRAAALGRACIAAKRFEEAASLLEKATALLSRDTGLLHLLAESYMQLGWLNQAEDAYRRINKLEPYDEIVKQKLKSISKGVLAQV